MSALSVFKKEVVDALRDRKTMMAVLLSSLFSGPFVVLILSFVFSGLEERAERREVWVQGIEHAPALANYLERQSLTIKAPPANFEEDLRKGQFNEAVLVVPKDFETQYAEGEVPSLVVLSNSTNRNVATSANRTERLASGFAREQGNLNAAVRGGSAAWANSIAVQERDLASAATRSAQLTGLVPFFIMIAVLYGALNAALDTTAGERERQSLEPLLANPVSRWQLVIGKWAAVALMGMAIAAFSAFSFFPAMALIKSEMLSALFQYGLREALAFTALLAPFAAAISAALMAVAIRSKSFKEAQAAATLVILAVNMTPLVSVFDPSGEKPWHLWVPGLGQQTAMLRVLKNDVLTWQHLLIPTLVCGLIAVVCLWMVSRTVKSMAVK